MNLPLSPAEIAAIAARYGATVAPDVTVARVPQGQMGQPDTVWIGARRFCNTPGVSNSWKGQNYSIGTPKKLSERSQRAAETRQKLATLHAEGLDDDELCAALGMGPGTLKVMRHHMRLKANPRKVDKAQVRQDGDIERRRAVITSGRTLKQAAVDLGWTYRRAQFLAAKSGIVSKASRGTAAAVKAREALILAMHHEDRAAWEVMEAVGYTRPGLESVLTRLGIRLKGPWGKPG